MPKIYDNINNHLNAGLITTLQSSYRADKKINEFADQAFARWKSLVEEKLAEEKPSRYENGVWTITYKIIGDIKQMSTSEFKAALEKVKGHETGWPPCLIPTSNHIAPYIFDNLLECWLKDSFSANAAHSDFWRASTEGMMFLLRGYQEDCEAKNDEPGTFLDLTLPVCE